MVASRSPDVGQGTHIPERTGLFGGNEFSGREADASATEGSENDERTGALQITGIPVPAFAVGRGVTSLNLEHVPILILLSHFVTHSKIFACKSLKTGWWRRGELNPAWLFKTSNLFVCTYHCGHYSNHCKFLVTFCHIGSRVALEATHV